MENDTPKYFNNNQNENGESYIYLGQRYGTRDKNQDKEIQRRITAGWTAFVKHRDTFKGNIGRSLLEETSLQLTRAFSMNILRTTNDGQAF